VLTEFPVCNILPALVYIWNAMYEIRANTFLKENLCALQVFLCALISQLMCARTS